VIFQQSSSIYRWPLSCQGQQNTTDYNKKLPSEHRALFISFTHILPATPLFLLCLLLQITMWQHLLTSLTQVLLAAQKLHTTAFIRSRGVEENTGCTQDKKCLLMVNLYSTDVICRSAGNFCMYFLNNVALYMWGNGLNLFSAGKLKLHGCDHQSAINSYI
jgi:hypothetical protein